MEREKEKNQNQQNLIFSIVKMQQQQEMMTTINQLQQQSNEPLAFMQKKLFQSNFFTS